MRSFAARRVQVAPDRGKIERLCIERRIEIEYTTLLTADNGAFGSPNLSEGDSFTTTFTTTAAYTYHCVFHAGMIGVVQVVDLSQRLYIPSLSRGPAC